MKIWELDTPALLIDRDILNSNLRRIQEFADRNQIHLRPHTKTHKMPYIASLQQAYGAKGIAVAKVGEAEVMAAWGLDDIMIANEITGEKKLSRIAALMDICRIQYGVDSVCQIREAEGFFASYGKQVGVVIEIEVGENRSGIIEEADFREMLTEILKSPHVEYRGVFGHDGNSYRAKDVQACLEISMQAQKKLLHFASLASEMGVKEGIVSYGSTPPVLCGCKILDGITELRIGTYALMDASQAHAIGTARHCAASVLATVISRPTEERVILDVGAKGLTMQERTEGICSSGGKGWILGYPGVCIDTMFDEHAIIHNKTFRDSVEIGDKVRVIPAHICPTVNLYDTAVFCAGEEVLETVPVLCRGKLQ